MHQTNTRSILRSLEYAPPVQDQPFVERHAGVLLSVALHAGLFACMFMQMSASDFEAKPLDRPKPIIVHLAPPAPAERAEPGGAAETGEPSVEESMDMARTRVMQTETDAARQAQPDTAARQVLQAVEKQVVAEQVASEQIERTQNAAVQIAAAAPEPVGRLTLDLPVEPADSASPTATAATIPASATSARIEQTEQPRTLAMALTSEARELLDELEASRKTRGAANRVEGYQGSGEVAHLLNLIEAEQVAQKTLFTERGLRKGVIRKIVTDNVDPNIAQQVFEKYGLKTFLASMNQSAKQNGAGYLNSAVTHQGKFVQPAGGKGIYHIFTYTDAAMAHMSRLEDAALEAQGMKPEYSRVISVTFGVVSTPKGYDLGVLNLLAEPTPH